MTVHYCQEYPSPPRDAILRPSTPDTCLDCNVSPCSLSVGETPSLADKYERASLDKVGQSMSNVSLGENGFVTPKKDGNGSERYGNDMKAEVLETANGSSPETNPDKTLNGLQDPKKNTSSHRRQISNMSIPESEISSCGTFIDKGSCDEVSRNDKPGLEHLSVAGGFKLNGDHSTGVENLEGQQADQLKPPESAFSMSDISEQLSAPINGEEDGLSCLTCKVTATSEEQLAIHKEGKRHRRHLAMAELQCSSPMTHSPTEASSSQDLHCDLCQVTAPTAQHREYHLRGQKHQRREKQHQLNEASAELANNSISAVLTDSDEEEGAHRTEEASKQLNAQAAGETLQSAPNDNQETASAELDASSQHPLKSPFEEFVPSKTLPHRSPVSQLPQPARSVRFNGSLQSFSEEPEDVTDENGPNPPLPPLGSNVSTSSYKLMTGGSFSSPAAHYCPVCGIIATSEANLEDHYQGRRHARRLQYLSHMPDGERTEHLQRTLTATNSGLFRQGSLVLPSSMDLTAYIGAVAQVHPPVPPAAPMTMEGAASLRARRSLNKQLSHQQFSWDSINGLHLHRQMTEPDSRGEVDDTETEKVFAVENGEGEVHARQQEEGEHAPEPQPKCSICGITTTSQAHMEAHKAGRKHRRRVEAAAGRTTVKSSAHYCPLCEISTTSSAHLALHLVGRAHRRRQKALEEGDSLHPVSLLQPDASDALVAELRSTGDTVSSAEVPDSSARLSGSGADAEGNGWYSTSGVTQRLEGSRGPPPLSGRAHSQPETAHYMMPHLPEASRQTSARASSADLKTRSPPRGPSNRPPIPPHLAPMGPPHPHSGYPMRLIPFPQPYYQQGSMGPFPPSPGGPPNYNWWAGPMAPMPQHQYPSRPPFQEGMYHPMGQYPPGPGMYGGHPSYPVMGMPMPGTYPGARPPNLMGYDPRGLPTPAPRDWKQQDTYNCETEKLDELKQHLRGKQHKRRLYNPAKAGWS